MNCVRGNAYRRRRRANERTWTNIGSSCRMWARDAKLFNSRARAREREKGGERTTSKPKTQAQVLEERDTGQREKEEEEEVVEKVSEKRVGGRGRDSSPATG